MYYSFLHKKIKNTPLGLINQRDNDIQWSYFMEFSIVVVKEIIYDTIKE